MAEINQIEANSWYQLEIKTDTNKATVAAILIMDGYTVRLATVKEPNGRAKKVLQYRKDSKT